jgi:hypothetical protein
MASKKFKAAGRRNFAIGRLKGMGNNLRHIMKTLRMELTPGEKIALHDAHKLIVEVTTTLSSRYYK